MRELLTLGSLGDGDQVLNGRPSPLVRQWIFEGSSEKETPVLKGLLYVHTEGSGPDLREAERRGLAFSRAAWILAGSALGRLVWSGPWLALPGLSSLMSLCPCGVYRRQPLPPAQASPGNWPPEHPKALR